MKSLFIIVFLVFFATVISLNSCKKIFDSTGELIYYTSFEQESDLDGWEGLSSESFRNDAPKSGGNNSVFVSGGCQLPTAKYTLEAVGIEQVVSFSCYGKNLTSGGTVFICIEDDINLEINIEVGGKDWIFYECKESIVWPANKDLSICLFSGGFVSHSMLIDELRVIKK